ncbi:hypothetical protein M426DRAFT_322970 [Hypoxylon sp. CI-4A]|nr:hypothetical protein M426DRAFT_322970 [Hypoxylon sp. CI-4A]
MRLSYICNLKTIAVSAITLSSLISLASASTPPSESPSAEAELICHTDNQADCYPKVFSATDEFQVLHEDQDLPPGLHVQLDVLTGQKLAKLYNPNEQNPALEGLPVDRSVVVVDSDGPQDDSLPVPSGAPAYEPVGVVKAPKEKNNEFTQALETIRQHASTEAGKKSISSEELDKALEGLEDLSHGMYYGLEIAKDLDVLEGLFCLFTSQDAEQLEKRPLTERHDFLASSILASSIRNNKPALQAVDQLWDTLSKRQCPNRPEVRSLRSELYSGLEPISGPGSVEEASETYYTRLNLAVLDGLLKSPKIKGQFMEHDGMKNFLRILLREEEVWDPRKAKVARIITDTFLDEDAGAVLGVWPTASVTDAKVCANGGAESLEEGCWEYHLENLSKNPRNAEWSRELLDLLRQKRAGKSASGRDEL